VSEMRADLKSLKERLDDELAELGIDSDLAGNLLLAYYSESYEGSVADMEYEKDDENPPKSGRRHNDAVDMTGFDGQQGDAGQGKSRRLEEDDVTRPPKKSRPNQ